MGNGGRPAAARSATTVARLNWQRVRVAATKLNLLRLELDEPLDEAGFRHVAATVGPRIGARRIGASVYEAEAGTPIWPYHYHHGIEEWLYVIAGAPVLREPAGERALSPGDVVCFPAGHSGAHTVRGPGRFVIFATGQHEAPYLTVYPDSDKVSGPEGILLRGSAVGYWHGEGTAGAAAPAERVREPASPAPLPVLNLADEAGGIPGAGRLQGTVADLGPGEGSEAYHYVYGRERWLLVLAGTPDVRHPDGEDRLEPGDLLCLPAGPAGAHELRNRGESVVRTLLLSTTGLPANVHFPDSGRWLLRNARGREDVAAGTGIQLRP
jgi:uncharacterized cupin superfamily protein